MDLIRKELKKACDNLSEIRSDTIIHEILNSIEEGHLMMLQMLI
jgi:hypothetical protein